VTFGKLGTFETFGTFGTFRAFGPLSTPGTIVTLCPLGSSYEHYEC
jgi:hypothetical protein